MGTASEENQDHDLRLARHIVARPRLTRLLDETDARVRILAAPAGYGKTTAARQWLRATTNPAVWYDATPASTDIAALATGVASSVAHLIPGAGALLDERLRAQRHGE